MSLFQLWPGIFLLCFYREFETVIPCVEVWWLAGTI